MDGVTIDEYTRIPDKWHFNDNVEVCSTSRMKMYFIDNGEEMTSDNYKCGLISFENCMRTFVDRLAKRDIKTNDQ